MPLQLQQSLVVGLVCSPNLLPRLKKLQLQLLPPLLLKSKNHLSNLFLLSKNLPLPNWTHHLPSSLNPSKTVPASYHLRPILTQEEI